MQKFIISKQKLIQNIEKDLLSKNTKLKRIEEDIALFYEDTYRKYELIKKYKLDNRAYSNREFQQILYLKLKDVIRKIKKTEEYQKKILNGQLHLKKPIAEPSKESDKEVLKVKFEGFEIKNNVVFIGEDVLIGKNRRANQQVFNRTRNNPYWNWYHANIRGGALVAGNPSNLEKNAAYALLFSKHSKVNGIEQGEVNYTSKITSTGILGSFNFGLKTKTMTADVKNLTVFLRVALGNVIVSLKPFDTKQEKDLEFTYSIYNPKEEHKEERILDLKSYLLKREYHLPLQQELKLNQIIPINWELKMKNK